MKNIFASSRKNTAEEIIEPLLCESTFELQRIVSTGQATPDDQWLSQQTHEWVVLLKGSATIRFEEGGQALTLKPGDFFIFLHRHVIAWSGPIRSGKRSGWSCMMVLGHKAFVPKAIT